MGGKLRHQSFQYYKCSCCFLSRKSLPQILVHVGVVDIQSWYDLRAEATTSPRILIDIVRLARTPTLWVPISSQDAA